MERALRWSINVGVVICDDNEDCVSSHNLCYTGRSERKLLVEVCRRSCTIGYFDDVMLIALGRTDFSSCPGSGPISALSIFCSHSISRDW